MQDTSITVTRGSAGKENHALTKAELSQRFAKFLSVSLWLFVVGGLVRSGHCCLMWCSVEEGNLKRMQKATNLYKRPHSWLRHWACFQDVVEAFPGLFLFFTDTELVVSGQPSSFGRFCDACHPCFHLACRDSACLSIARSCHHALT